jgi:hypothetical protein
MQYVFQLATNPNDMWRFESCMLLTLIRTFSNHTEEPYIQGLLRMLTILIIN